MYFFVEKNSACALALLVSSLDFGCLLFDFFGFGRFRLLNMLLLAFLVVKLVLVGFINNRQDNFLTGYVQNLVIFLKLALLDLE